MALNLIELKNLELKRMTDIIAASLIFYFENFKEIFKKIIVWQFISIIFLVFLFVSLYGEFHLTFFISNEGLIWISFFLITILLNTYNSIYNSIKIICFQNMELRLSTFKIQILSLVLVRLFLIILLIISIYFSENILLMIFVYLILNTLFYFYLFKEADNKIRDQKLKVSLWTNFVLNLKATRLIILSRILIILIPFLATFSIIIVYVFVRYMIEEKIFFLMSEKFYELIFFLILFFILLLILNPFQYLILFIFYKYHNQRAQSNNNIELRS